jgi:hypothetical protein
VVETAFIDVAATQFVFQSTWTQASSRAPVLSVRTTHVACDRGGADGRFARTTLWPELRAAIERHTTPA